MDELGRRKTALNAPKMYSHKEKPDEPENEIKAIPIKKKPFFATRKKSLNSSAHLKLKRNNMALAKELNKYKEDYAKLLGLLQQSQEEVLSFRHSRNKIKNSLDIIYNKTIDSLRAVGTLADYLRIMHSEVTSAKAYNEVEESLLSRNADKFNHQDTKFRMTLPARLPDLDSHNSGFNRGAKTQSVNPMISGYAIHKPNIRLRRMELHDMPLSSRHNSAKKSRVPRQSGKYPVRRFGPQVRDSSVTVTGSPNENTTPEEETNDHSTEETRSNHSTEEIRNNSIPEEITISSDEEDVAVTQNGDNVLNGETTEETSGRNSRVARVSLERIPVNQLENIGMCMQQIGQECNEVPDFLFGSTPSNTNTGRELKIALHDVRGLLNSSGCCKINDSALDIVHEHPNDVEFRNSGECDTSLNKRLKEGREEFLQRVLNENPLEGTSWEYDNLLDHEREREERRRAKVAHRKKKKHSPEISPSLESNQTIYEGDNMSFTECVGPYLQRTVPDFSDTNNASYRFTKNKIANVTDSTLSDTQLMSEDLQNTERTDTSIQSEHTNKNDTICENETSQVGRTSTPTNSISDMKRLQKDNKEKHSASPIKENTNSDFNRTNFETFPNISCSPSKEIPNHSPKQTPVKHKNSNIIPENAVTPIKTTPRLSLTDTPKSTKHKSRKATPPLILIPDSPEPNEAENEDVLHRITSKNDNTSASSSTTASSARETSAKKNEKKSQGISKKINWKSQDKSFTLDSSSSSSNDETWIPDNLKRKKKKDNSVINGKIKKHDKTAKKSAGQNVTTRSPSSRPSSRNEGGMQNGLDSVPADRPENRPQRRAKKKGPGSFAEPSLNKKLRRP